ncbi:winged helix-turn-helix domain-containing protein [Streptomyces sp. NPDC048518]|uniref:winged helix-turn-helix domain-containing protein n=1 Tax=Streptomyces sp. NPDC048518 TaxID=3155029 RepID=UPI0033E157E4
MTEASPRGTYLVIVDALRQEIEGGEHLSGLPSEAELMRKHGVARNTIRRALKTLEAEGVLVSAPGIGWRVSQDGDRRSLVERMVAVIEEDSLKVGDTYPSEAKLCERFGVSRTAVRRGLAHMEGTGLLDTVHGKGRTVRTLPSPTVGP